MPSISSYRGCRLIVPKQSITNDEYASLKLTVLNYRDNLLYCQELSRKPLLPGGHIMAQTNFRIAIHQTLWSIGDGLHQFADRDNICHQITYNFAPSGWAVFFVAMENIDKLAYLEMAFKAIGESISPIEEFLAEQDELIDQQRLLELEKTFHRIYSGQTRERYWKCRCK
ncbi:hypothetical protein AA313_de0207546 [Arthrobotrys entomopaga]|nr:hypothetical protein AA313_de0207546 [Arthrobotrys entomopaga]